MHIRQASIRDAEEMARVHVDYWKSSYKDILPDDIIENLSYSDREKRWLENLPSSTSGGTMTYVAEDVNGRMAGFALGGTMRDARLRIKYTGELYGLFVHPEYEGWEIARQLFINVTDHLISLHHSGMALWTFENHHSCSFYKQMGGEKIYDKKTDIAGRKLNELAFGWDDIETLSYNSTKRTMG